MNWTTVATLTAACLPGILIATPAIIDTVLRRARQQPTPPARPLPPRRVLIAASMAQTTLLAAGAAALGAAFGPQVGLAQLSTDAFQTPAGALTALSAAVLGSAAMLAAYYGVFRPRLDPQTLTASEGLRQEAGLASRVLYGGVVEEVLMRWGLLPLAVWLLTFPLGAGAATFWTANLLTGLLFAALHWPAYLSAGCRPTPAFFTASVVLNTALALLYGWLFLQYGLLAAVLGHAVTHLMWSPLDRRMWRSPALPA